VDYGLLDLLGARARRDLGRQGSSLVGLENGIAGDWGGLDAERALETGTRTGRHDHRDRDRDLPSLLNRTTKPSNGRREERRQSLRENLFATPTHAKPRHLAKA